MRALTTEQLFRAHSAFVRRLLYGLGLGVEVAEDVLQEVFLVVHRRDGYRPGAAKPTTYLASIALHVARDHRRRKRIEAARLTHVELDQLACADDPLRAFDVRQQLERVRLALDYLPEELCTTFLRVDVAGESCVRVAESLRVPVGTVYSRQHLAHKRLQAILACLDAQRTQPARFQRRRRAEKLLASRA
jgi:RNA polymerase sigma-70 factor, ECF subfamily